MDKKTRWDPEETGPETSVERMNKREAYAEGKKHGAGAAFWLDIPEIGQAVWTDADGEVIVTQANRFDVCLDLALAGEENARQFSPWEFLAARINRQRPDWRRDGLWESYDEGVFDGAAKELRERLKFYREAVEAAQEVQGC